MPLKTLREEQPTLNLAPMIDIIFLLLIFFIVGTRFSELNEAERDISLNVPQVAKMGDATAAAKKRLINVYSDGRIELDRSPISLDELRSVLTSEHQQHSQLGVVVRGDAGSRYQNIADVIAACHLAQITDLNIAVRVAKLER